MRDGASSKKEKRPKFDPTKWMHEHPKFVIWWKEHSHSGFAERESDHKQAWGIEPWKAWDNERYRAEFTLESPDPVINTKIPEWLAEEQKAKAMTAELEKRFGSEFWKRMTPFEFIKATKQVAHEMVDTKTMRAKINKAYETELGQSEEETELLRRRRP